MSEPYRVPLVPASEQIYSCRVIFDAHRLRDRGWLLPRFRACMHRPVRGALRLHEEIDRETHRHRRVARLLDPLTHTPLDVPPLYDAILVYADSDCMTLSGIEPLTDGLGDREFAFAQSWLLEYVSIA